MAQSLQDQLTVTQIASIVRCYEEGESSIKIAAHYNVTSSTIIKLLRAQGVEIKSRGRYAA